MWIKPFDVGKWDLKYQLKKLNSLQDNNKNNKGNNNMLVNINLKSENQIKQPTL